MYDAMTCDARRRRAGRGPDRVALDDVVDFGVAEPHGDVEGALARRPRPGAPGAARRARPRATTGPCRRRRGRSPRSRPRRRGAARWWSTSVQPAGFLARRMRSGRPSSSATVRYRPATVSIRRRRPRRRASGHAEVRDGRGDRERGVGAVPPARAARARGGLVSPSRTRLPSASRRLGVDGWAKPHCGAVEAVVGPTQQRGAAGAGGGVVAPAGAELDPRRLGRRCRPHDVRDPTRSRRPAGRDGSRRPCASCRRPRAPRRSGRAGRG